ncbi:MAG: IS110 family transposase [Erysipelotrichaceae bacterium]|nr:IS110 family transposase [Erysipelotrichaceae bacterium]
MKRIIKIGMDVHTTNYTLCVFEPSFEHEGTVHYITQVKPEVKNIIDVIDNLKKKLSDDELDITCGYEAGCLGYSLYHELEDKGVRCIILAPTTMAVQKGGKKIKNDYRDAEQIARCLAYGGYSAVYVPTALDNSVKEFIRMRDDLKQNLKSIKQQIIALLTRNGKQYDEGSYWTGKHIKWINSIKFEEIILQETLSEYMVEYYHLVDRVSKLDERIEEISMKEIYIERVNKLKCFIGIKTHTALSLIVETSDFKRFTKGNIYAAYLGLIPGDDSSGDDDSKLGITKAGNRHLRRLLIESAQCYTRGQIGHISVDLRQRQALCSSEVTAYANKANERLRRKYYRMIGKGKKFNVAKTAIARELACFVWGMMSDHIELAH